MFISFGESFHRLHRTWKSHSHLAANQTQGRMWMSLAIYLFIYLFIYEKTLRFNGLPLSTTNYDPPHLNSVSMHLILTIQLEDQFRLYSGLTAIRKHFLWHYLPIWAWTAAANDSIKARIHSVWNFETFVTSNNRPHLFKILWNLFQYQKRLMILAFITDTHQKHKAEVWMSIYIWEKVQYIYINIVMKLE